MFQVFNIFDVDELVVAATEAIGSAASQLTTKLGTVHIDLGRVVPFNVLQDPILQLVDHVWPVVSLASPVVDDLRCLRVVELATFLTFLVSVLVCDTIFRFFG